MSRALLALTEKEVEAACDELVLVHHGEIVRFSRAPVASRR